MITGWPYNKKPHNEKERYLEALLEGHPLLCTQDTERSRKYERAKQDYDNSLIPTSRRQLWQQQAQQQLQEELQAIITPLKHCINITLSNTQHFINYATTITHLKQTITITLTGALAGALYESTTQAARASTDDIAHAAAIAGTISLGAAALNIAYRYKQEQRVRQQELEDDD